VKPKDAPVVLRPEDDARLKNSLDIDPRKAGPDEYPHICRRMMRIITPCFFSHSQYISVDFGRTTTQAKLKGIGRTFRVGDGDRPRGT
jgi:hypothetical protein